MIEHHINLSNYLGVMARASSAAGLLGVKRAKKRIKMWIKESILTKWILQNQYLKPKIVKSGVV